MQHILDDFEIPNISEDANRPIREEIRRWKLNITNGCYSPDDIRRSQVFAVDWYKSTYGFEDEHLVATCQRPGGVEFYLRIERQPYPPSLYDDLIPVEAPPAHTIPDIHFPPLLFESSLRDVEFEGQRQLLKLGSWMTDHIAAGKAKKQELMALDSVTRVNNPEESPENGERVQFIARYQAFKKPFYVRDLAFLADSVTARQPLHQIFPHQGFWYPRSILNVAAAVYHPAVVHGPGFGNAGTYGIRRASCSVYRLTLNEDCQDETNIIREAFESALESHTTKVKQRFFARCGRLQEKLEEEIWKQHKLEGELARGGWGN